MSHDYKILASMSISAGAAFASMKKNRRMTTTHAPFGVRRSLIAPFTVDYSVPRRDQL